MPRSRLWTDINLDVTQHLTYQTHTCGVKGCPGAQVQMVDADRCGVRMSGDGALTPHRVTSGSVVSSSNGLPHPGFGVLPDLGLLPSV